MCRGGVICPKKTILGLDVRFGRVGKKFSIEAYENLSGDLLSFAIRTFGRPTPNPTGCIRTCPEPSGAEMPRATC
jgi:hypothetical protein